MLFHLLKLPLKRLPQHSVAPITSIMIIDGRRYRYSKCDIGSSFTHFHPAPLWRHRASLSISVDCDWLEGILVLLPFSRAPFRPACLQASFWNWLMDWLCEWQDQCSRTTSSRDRPRSHMTPYMSQYVLLSTNTVDSQHSNKNSGKNYVHNRILCQNQTSQVLWHVSIALWTQWYQNEVWIEFIQNLLLRVLGFKAVKLDHTAAVRPLIHIQKSLLISVSELPFANYSFRKQFVVSFQITEPLYRAYSCIKPFLSEAFLCLTWCFTYFKVVFLTHVYSLNPSGSPRHHKDVVHDGDSVQGQSKGEVPQALVTSVRLPVGNCTLNLLVCVGGNTR